MGILHSILEECSRYTTSSAWYAIGVSVFPFVNVIPAADTVFMLYIIGPSVSVQPGILNLFLISDTRSASDARLRGKEIYIRSIKDPRIRMNLDMFEFSVCIFWNLE